LNILKNIDQVGREMGKEGSSCSTSGCKIESIITIDERGQMVLPKEVRERTGIRPGDKLVLISWEKDGSICCLTLIKAQDLAEMVKGLLGPMIAQIRG